MLVITRKLGETIIIGNGITITIVNIDRGKIRIGVEADKSIPVYRGEIWEQIKEGRKQE